MKIQLCLAAECITSGLQCLQHCLSVFLSTQPKQLIRSPPPEDEDLSLSILPLTIQTEPTHKSVLSSLICSVLEASFCTDFVSLVFCGRRLARGPGGMIAMTVMSVFLGNILYLYVAVVKICGE
jgi:hypothetical protein